MVRTCSRPRSGAALAVGPLDKTVDGAAPERAVLPWLRPPSGPDTAGSCSIAPAGNDEAACSEPGAPHNEPDAAGCGDTAHADIVEARRPWGGEQHDYEPWPRTPIGPDTTGSSSNAPAGNDEAAGREPGGPCDKSRGQRERNRRRNRRRRAKRKGSKASARKEAPKPPGMASAELLSTAQAWQGRPAEPQGSGVPTVGASAKDGAVGLRAEARSFEPGQGVPQEVAALSLTSDPPTLSAAAEGTAPKAAQEHNLATLGHDGPGKDTAPPAPLIDPRVCGCVGGPTQGP